MPTLAEWPPILASAAEAVLSVPELGYTIPVTSYPPASLIGTPQLWIEPEPGIFLEPSSAGATLSTLSQLTAFWSLRLVVGDPGSEGAMVVALDALQRLHAGYADAVAADVASGGFRPAVGTVLTPTAEQYVATPVWSVRLPFSTPVAKIPPSTP
jgi:hypothetical protein